MHPFKGKIRYWYYTHRGTIHPHIRYIYNFFTHSTFYSKFSLCLTTTQTFKVNSSEFYISRK